MSEDRNEKLIEIVGYLRFYFLESKGTRDEFGRRLDSLTKDQGVRITEQTEPTRTIIVSNEKNVRTVYHFDESGKPISFTNAAGQITKAIYDDKGNMTEVHFPNGNVSRYKYNASGQPIYFDEPGSKGLYTRSFDSQGNLQREHTSRYGTIEMGYDDSGKLLELTNNSGGTSYFSYDCDSRLLTTTSPTGATEVLTRDANGHVVAKKDFAGGLTQTTYDSQGRPLTNTFANGDIQEWNYDSAGNNRLISINGAPSTQFDYEQNPDGTFYVHSTEYLTPVQPSWRESYHLNAQGQHLGRTVNGVTYRWERDQLGRAIAYYGPDGIVVKRRYSDKGDLIGLTDSTGYSIEYERDDLGNIVGYESPNLSRKVTWVNGRVSTIEDNRQDVYGRLYSKTSFLPDSFGADRIERNDATTRYRLDGARQLTGIHHTDAKGKATSVGLLYDYAGRLTESVVADGIVKKYTYSADCRLLEIRGEDGSLVQNYYDERGRRVRTETSGGACDGDFAEFSWDSRGYLWQLSQGGTNKETVTHQFWFNHRGELSWVDGVTIAWDSNPGQEPSVVAIGNKTLTLQDFENITCTRPKDPVSPWSEATVAHPNLPAGVQIGLGWKFRIGQWDLRMDGVIDLEQLQRLNPRTHMEPIGFTSDFNPYAYLNNNPLPEFSPWNI